MTLRASLLRLMAESQSIFHVVPISDKEQNRNTYAMIGI